MPLIGSLTRNQSLGRSTLTSYLGRTYSSTLTSSSVLGFSGLGGDFPGTQVGFGGNRQFQRGHAEIIGCDLAAENFEAFGIQDFHCGRFRCGFQFRIKGHDPHDIWSDRVYRSVYPFPGRPANCFRP